MFILSFCRRHIMTTVARLGKPAQMEQQDQWKPPLLPDQLHDYDRDHLCSDCVSIRRDLDFPDD